MKYEILEIGENSLTLCFYFESIINLYNIEFLQGALNPEEISRFTKGEKIILSKDAVDKLKSIDPKSTGHLINLYVELNPSKFFSDVSLSNLFKNELFDYEHNTWLGDLDITPVLEFRPTPNKELGNIIIEVRDFLYREELEESSIRIDESLKYCNPEKVMLEVLDHAYRLLNNPTKRVVIGGRDTDKSNWLGYYLYRKINEI